MTVPLLPCFSVSLAAHGRYAQKLMTDLFSNYTNALRPVEDTDHIINVTLQITLSQIIDMVMASIRPAHNSGPLVTSHCTCSHMCVFIY